MAASLPGLGRHSIDPRDRNSIEHVMVRRPLQRVMAFLGYSIHDVCNDPIARDAVRGFYKLHRSVEREVEIGELERQWNPLGVSSR